MISSIKMRIKSKQMKLLDAYRLFDYNHDGMLSCSELYGGLEWLGMKLTPESINKKINLCPLPFPSLLFPIHFILFLHIFE
jgi:Ca2+-binding EF-hand superfamily protein